MDSVDGRLPSNISNLFADTLAPGASDTQDYVLLARWPRTRPDHQHGDGDRGRRGSRIPWSPTQPPATPTSRTSRASTSPSPARSRFRSVEAIEYTITVENTGNEALVGVTVNDTLLGDITGDFDFDFANPFPVGCDRDTRSSPTRRRPATPTRSPTR